MAVCPSRPSCCCHRFIVMVNSSTYTYNCCFIQLFISDRTKGVTSKDTYILSSIFISVVTFSWCFYSLCGVDSFIAAWRTPFSISSYGAGLLATKSLFLCKCECLYFEGQFLRDVEFLVDRFFFFYFSTLNMLLSFGPMVMDEKLAVGLVEEIACDGLLLSCCFQNCLLVCWQFGYHISMWISLILFLLELSFLDV